MKINSKQEKKKKKNVKREVKILNLKITNIIVDFKCTIIFTIYNEDVLTME